jgi:hypothetical protein
MINHTDKILSPELVNVLFAEETRIKEENKVSGNIEVDRVKDEFLELLFDGYYPNGRWYRLIGTYNIALKKFDWV